MNRIILTSKWIFIGTTVLLLTSCATTQRNTHVLYSDGRYYDDTRFEQDFTRRLPQHMDTNGKKLVLVDPKAHAWGAYGADGNLVRAGLATAGGEVCPPDEDAATCATTAGKFRIASLGDGECFSKIYPKPDGGGLMPYCMFFNGGQALHGSPDPTVVEDNVSHGCVRMRIQDAEWMRYNFAQVGTTVQVLPYN